MSVQVARVLDRLKIRYSPLPKQGRLWGLCPYHKDHHATNWMIRCEGERSGQHHCFVCKNGGGLAELVSHVRGIAISSALVWLEEMGAGHQDVEPVPSAETIVIQEMTPSAIPEFKMPPGVVTSQEDWPESAARYLTSRGIPNEQRTKWGLGYATYGRLVGRIIIPIRSLRGQLASYHARTFVGAKRRYFYPSGEEHPDLDVLFGEEFWPALLQGENVTIVRRPFVVVTEGAFNALAVERAYQGPVAAIGGSQFREGHAFRLSTFARVVILTDADEAGDRIASELTAALFRHTQVDRVRLQRDADETPCEDLRRILFGTLQQTF